MGLDITAYRGLTKANGSEAFDERGEVKEDEGWERFYLNGDFPGRADEIDDGCAYKSEASAHMLGYSYSTHSRFRNELAKLAGYPKAEPSNDGEAFDRVYEESYPYATAASAYDGMEAMPFYELVYFSDCEGVIGTTVSAKLARDFAAFQEKADAHHDEYFRAKYSQWRKAFEMASDRGAVVFH